MRTRQILFLIFLLPALRAPAAPKEKPVSLSYQNLLRCFPEIRDSRWTTKVDLNQLKEAIDRLYVSTHSVMRFRQSVLKGPTGAQKRLTWSAKPNKAGLEDDHEFTLENLDAKGAGVPVILPASQRINPLQRDLDAYFVNQEILSDDRSYFDTKIKDMSLSYKEHFKDIHELEWNDPQQKRRILCEKQDEIGVVCTCFRK